MNLVEKILARASGRDSVEPGEIVVAKVDRLIMHDLSGYLTSQVYEKRVNAPIPDLERAVLVSDHHFAPPTEQQAEVLRHNREWARKHGLTLYDCGNGNLHHAVVRKGHIKPAMIVVGSDSHTPVHGTLGALAVALGNDSHAGTVLPYGTAWFKVPETTGVHLEGTPKPGVTPRDVALWLVGRIGEGELNYRAVEFGGPYVRGLSFWDRWLFPLLCVDLGAKCSFVEPDEVTEAFVRTLPGNGPDLLVRGDGEEAAQVLRFDVGEVDPQVACPPTVGNVKQPQGVRRGGAGRAGARAARGGCDVVPAEHGLEPGVQHGRAGRGRGDDLHARPQLPRPQRKSRRGDVPGVVGDRRRVGRGGRHRREDRVKFEGRCWRFGDNIPTDRLVKTQYVFEPMDVLVRHVLEDLNPEFPKQVRPGDIVFAGKHFGQSSGRAIATKALQATGIGCVVAETFARTFYRNFWMGGAPPVSPSSAAAWRSRACRGWHRRGPRCSAAAPGRSRGTARCTPSGRRTPPPRRGDRTGRTPRTPPSRS